VNIEAEEIIVDIFEKANEPAKSFLEEKGEEDELALWQVHFESLKKTSEKGGSTKLRDSIEDSLKKLSEDSRTRIKLMTQ
jgi:hypothetical protein